MLSAQVGRSLRSIDNGRSAPVYMHTQFVSVGDAVFFVLIEVMLSFFLAQWP